MIDTIIETDKIKEKIKGQVDAAILSIIPQEAFDAFVSRAWREMTDPQPILDYQGRPKGRTNPPELITMLKNEMRSQLRIKVAEWAEEWRETDQCSAMAEGVLEKCSAAASNAFLESVKQSAVRTAVEKIMEATDRISCSSCGKYTHPENCEYCGQWNNG